MRLSHHLMKREEKYYKVSMDYDRLKKKCESLKSCIQTMIESFAGVSCWLDEKIKFLKAQIAHLCHLRKVAGKV